MQIAEAAERDASMSNDEWVLVGPISQTQNQQDDEHVIQDLELLHVECSDEDDDAYNDALHDYALDEYKEQSCMPNALTRAVDRYDADLVRETWQEYVGSVGTPARRKLHEEKMMKFRGYGPDPEPFLQGSDYFNPLFESMWLPWAIDAQYWHNEDIGLLGSEVGGLGFDLHMLAAHFCMHSAIPTRPMLEYMVNHAPKRNIAHIDGTSSLYWASLLKCLGANILVVTEGSPPGRTTASSFGDFSTTGEETFFECNMANEQALFFCQRSDNLKGATDDDGVDAQMSSCLFERCLFGFSGNVVFFVGEMDKRTKSFDMAQWVDDNSDQGWRIKKEIELPCWPGCQDVFLCCVKEEPSDGA